MFPVNNLEWLMDAEYRMRLSEAVRRARGDLSQRQFAKRLGVSYPAVRSWEEGESIPGLENIEAIAAALGMPLEEFLAHIRGSKTPSPETTTAETLIHSASRLSKAEITKLMHYLVERLAKDDP